MPRRYDDDDDDDDDYYDDEPRRPRKKKFKKKSTTPVGLIVGGVVLAAVVGFAVIGVIGYSMLKKEVAKANNAAVTTGPSGTTTTTTGNPQPQAQVVVKFSLSNLRREPHPNFRTKMVLSVDYEFTGEGSFLPSQYTLCIKTKSGGVSRIGFGGGIGRQGPRDTMTIEQFGFGDNFKGAVEVWVEEGPGGLVGGKRVSEVLTATL